jgi:hypothetical protein
MSSVRLTAGYTLAKLFLYSPGIALEKYTSLSLCFCPRRRHMHGRPDAATLLEEEGVTVEIRENPSREIMKRAQDRNELCS